MTNDQHIPNSPHPYALVEEWKSLQHSYDRYEGLSLLIKLGAFASWAFSTVIAMDLAFTLALVALIWFQEAIWKTFQARTEDRLLSIEKAWKQQNEAHTLSFYTDWQKQRPGTIALVKAYVKNAFRPTIAYPYVLLLVATVLL